MTDELDTLVAAANTLGCKSIGCSFDVIPTDLEGPPTGPVENVTEIFYPSGTLHIRVEGYKMPTGERIKHGMEYIFHENGNIKKETMYVHNKRYGECKSFYDNGVLEAFYKYNNDKVCGYAYNYYPDGNMKSQAQWSNGLFNGQVTIYWPNGCTIHVETHYVDGKRHGFERVFFETDKINYTAFWNNNLQDGIETRYDEKGFTIMKLYWKMGLLQARKICHTKKLTPEEICAKALAAKTSATSKKKK